jgi:hypothetical protein
MSLRKGKYMLEVYLPGSLEDVAWCIESETPFQAINAGDILSSVGIAGFAETEFHAPVGAVQHAIWSVNETTFGQKTMIFLADDCWNSLREKLRQKVEEQSQPSRS